VICSKQVELVAKKLAGCSMTIFADSEGGRRQFAAKRRKLRDRFLVTSLLLVEQDHCRPPQEPRQDSHNMNVEYQETFRTRGWPTVFQFQVQGPGLGWQGLSTPPTKRAHRKRFAEELLSRRGTSSLQPTVSKMTRLESRLLWCWGTSTSPRSTTAWTRVIRVGPMALKG